MKIPHFITTILLLTSFLGSSQDTIKMGKSYTYSAGEVEKYSRKEFAATVRYSREDIVFNDGHKRIEYCYYIEEQRNCHGKTYKVIGDSTLEIQYYDETPTKWHFSKRNDGSYEIYKDLDGVIKRGIAESIIPLKIRNKLYTVSKNTADTLWVEDYAEFQLSNPYSKPTYSNPKAKIKGKVYEPMEVDKLPTLENGEPFPETIYHKRTDGCYGEPRLYVKQMLFVVTKEGDIKNIKQGHGNFSMDFCPQYILELMVKIDQLGKLKPALVKGKPVNSIFYVNIDMSDNIITMPTVKNDSSLNQYDRKGNKDGTWIVYLDSSLNPVDSAHSLFYAYESYDHGKVIFEHYKGRNSDVDSMLFSGSFPKIGNPILLSGNFSWFTSDGRIVNYEKYNNGWPVYYKSYQYYADEPQVCGFNEVLDWSKKYQNIEGTYYYEELWKGEVSYRGYFRKGKKGWKVYKIKD